MRYEVDLSEASKFARTPAYGIPVIRAAAACGPDGGTLGATNRFLTRDGSPWIPIAGEMHYFADRRRTVGHGTREDGRGGHRRRIHLRVLEPP